MSTGARVPLREARVEALDLVKWFQPVSNRVEVAGSIRRGAPDVGDIELVMEPLIVNAPDGMFGTIDMNMLTVQIDQLIQKRVLASHPTDPKRGDRYSKVVHVVSGLQVDIFSVLPPASWGVIFLIRTGPAAFSHGFVNAIRKRGFHVADGQLHRGSLGCGAIACEVIPTPEERDVLAAVGMPWIEPWDRQ